MWPSYVRNSCKSASLSLFNLVFSEDKASLWVSYSVTRFYSLAMTERYSAFLSRNWCNAHCSFIKEVFGMDAIVLFGLERKDSYYYFFYRNGPPELFEWNFVLVMDWFYLLLFLSGESIDEWCYNLLLLLVWIVDLGRLGYFWGIAGISSKVYWDWSFSKSITMCSSLRSMKWFT